jgi:hypothetical protein
MTGKEDPLPHRLKYPWTVSRRELDLRGPLGRPGSDGPRFDGPDFDGPGSDREPKWKIIVSDNITFTVCTVNQLTGISKLRTLYFSTCTDDFNGSTNRH